MTVSPCLWRAMVADAGLSVGTRRLTAAASFSPFACASSSAGRSGASSATRRAAMDRPSRRPRAR
eukprot:3779625-Lingulodinium_polyedra.AAC.1